MFGANVIEKAKQHASNQYPKESCGLVVDDEYFACGNVAYDPNADFIIDPKDYLSVKLGNKTIQAVIHSHTNGEDHPSKPDMEKQLQMQIPWGIILAYKDGGVADPFWFGDQVPIPPYVGRPFRHGVTDCYALVRDWFWQEYDIRLPSYSRGDQWWKKGEDMFTQLFMDAGFAEIHRPQLAGDILIGKLLGKVPNHCAVYLGNGLILHHLSNRLSNREPADRWMRFITMTVRHKDISC
jgi:proteasome lid subunit RPN8/RPN11